MPLAAASTQTHPYARARKHDRDRITLNNWVMWVLDMGTSTSACVALL